MSSSPERPRDFDENNTAEPTRHDVLDVTIAARSGGCVVRVLVALLCDGR